MNVKLKEKNYFVKYIKSKIYKVTYIVFLQ